MKGKKAFYILIAVIILTVGVLTAAAIADAGNFSGGSDYGGDWGGGSDWGGSDDWSGSGSGFFIFGGSGDDGGGGGSVVAVIFIVFIIAVFAFGRSRMNVKTGNKRASNSYPIQNVALSPISELIQKDPKFSEAVMAEKVSNLYVRMQNAWQDKNFEPMRPFMTDALYNQFARQLDELVRASRTNYVERIAVLEVRMDGWTQDDVSDSLIATISARIVDYTLDDRTRKLVSGSKTAEKFMTYQWTLVRSRGMLTPERAGTGRDGTVEISCPSCGAAVEINQSAKCEYCGSIISARDYDWSISAIKGISQRTSGR